MWCRYRFIQITSGHFKIVFCTFLPDVPEHFKQISGRKLIWAAASISSQQCCSLGSVGSTRDVVGCMGHSSIISQPAIVIVCSIGLLYKKITKLHHTQRTNKHPHKTRPVQAYVKNTHLKALCHTHITIACYDMILLTFFQRPLFMKIVFACRAFELKRFGVEQMRRRQLPPLLWTFRSRRIVSTTFCFEKMSI